MKEFFEVFKSKVIHRLNTELDKRLHYHNSEHTIDVIKQTERIAKAEGISDDETLNLLRIASLYHDSGFLFTYNNHEVKGCEIVRKDLEAYAFTNDQLDTIDGLIMATKVPQQPMNHLEKIICDADLDYLGRGDYMVISDCLRRELFEFGYITNEKDWLNLQINFLENHNYFTDTSKKSRTNKKNIVLSGLKEKLENYKS